MARILSRGILIAALGVPLSLFSAAPLAFWPVPAHAQLTGTLSGLKFVEAAAISGMFEMEASTLALQKSQNPQVRAFAERMLHDHAAIMKELKTAAESTAAESRIPLPTVLDGKHETMLERLKAANGADFDTLYVQVQTQAHDAAVGIFAAFEKDGDQAVLKSFAAKTLPILKAHLDAVQQLQVKT